MLMNNRMKIVFSLIVKVRVKNLKVIVKLR